MRKLVIALLLVAVVLLVLPAPALAHNVTFRAHVTVTADGTGVTVYVDDILRNPVPDGSVTIESGGSTALLTESERGLYSGVFPRQLRNEERVSIKVGVGRNNDVWAGSGKVLVGSDTSWVLFHQHGIDGRTFSIVMTIVFGTLLVMIGIYEVIRWRRRNAMA